jgi:hypothetical protein
MCSHCGASLQFVDPKTAPINHMKLQALGDLLPRFAELAEPGERSDAAVVTWGLLGITEYISRKTVAAESLVNRCGEIAGKIQITSPQSAGAVATRQQFEQLLAYATEARNNYDAVTSTRLPDNFQPVTLSLADMFRAILQLYTATAEMILALTTTDFAAAERTAQACLDRAGQASSRMAAALQECVDDGKNDRKRPGPPG